MVLELAQQNIQQATGGPFAAAIFNEDTGTVVSAGVNLVVRSNYSMAHAEVIAITFAQRAFDTFDLARPGIPRLQLVTSTEPCVMCFGALTWSGVRSLVCGARDEDARAIGFDEGAKTPDWIAGLERRGIAVQRDICRTDAVAVLQEYQAGGGIIYNSSPKSSEKIQT